MTAERTAHALVLGKMYPPHVGHELLVRTAAAVSERVSVLVLAHPCESLPVADRVRWLQQTVDDLPNVAVVGGIDAHPIDYDDPAVWDLHMEVFRAVLREQTTEPVTAVFTSEDYGDELARRFDATHVLVDPARVLAPVSGKSVRSDVVRSWELLPPPVRSGLALRVVVIGAESTGTTTVSLALTDALRARGGAHGLTRVVPEYGRDRTITLLARARAVAALRGDPAPGMEDLSWPTEEFVSIAAEQNRLEDDAARVGGPVLVCDTDAFATGVWHERYCGTTAPKVEALGRSHSLYLLTHDEGVPFHQDGIRDGEAIRSWMTGRFLEAMSQTGRRYVVLRGSLQERVIAGLDAIDELLREGWGFTDPLG